MRAWSEARAFAFSGSRVAMVLARMPFTRQGGRFLGLGALGSGGGAVVKFDLATMLRSVSRGVPGSSLETHSNCVTACWMCFFVCLAVGAVVALRGTLG